VKKRQISNFEKKTKNTKSGKSEKCQKIQKIGKSEKNDFTGNRAKKWVLRFRVRMHTQRESRFNNKNTI